MYDRTYYQKPQVLSGNWCLLVLSRSFLAENIVFRLPVVVHFRGRQPPLGFVFTHPPPLHRLTIHYAVKFLNSFCIDFTSQVGTSHRRKKKKNWIQHWFKHAATPVSAYTRGGNCWRSESFLLLSGSAGKSSWGAAVLYTFRNLADDRLGGVFCRAGLGGHWKFKIRRRCSWGRFPRD